VRIVPDLRGNVFIHFYFRNQRFKEAEMSTNSRHVISSLKKGWSVRKTGASRASRTFEQQEEAIAYARELAIKEHVDLYIHRRDGTISHKDSYGSDPCPPKSKN
jgi:hypothetical protein